MLSSAAGRNWELRRRCGAWRRRPRLGVGVTIPPPRYELGVGQFFPLKMDDSHILKVYVSWGMGNDEN